jgi:diguanylate cyclase (GGDEF)-like protein/PAS domain S-box-containing protein
MTDFISRSFFSPVPFLSDASLTNQESAQIRVGGIVEPSDFRANQDSIERITHALQDSETRLQTLLETSSEGLVIINNSGKVLFVNPAAERLFNRPARLLLGEEIGIPLLIGEFTEVEIPFADGSFKRVDMRVLEFSWQGNPAYMAFLRDVTKLKQAEERLKILYQAIEQSSAAIVITDAQGRIEYVNSRYERLTGHQASEMIGQLPSYMRSGEMPIEVYRDLRAKINRGLEWCGEFINKRKGGDRFWERVSISPVKDEHGHISHFVAVKEDISDRKHQEAMLSYQANHDALTGLPNRTLAMDRLKQDLSRAKRRHQRVGVMFVDLDHFKDVNDVLGHEYGDQLLKMVSQRLLDCLRESDTVARLGGDEFLVILPELDSPDRCGPIAEKLLNVLEAPFPISGKEVFISASIGCTIYPDDGENISALLRNADTAMYGIKREGRDGFKYYTPDLNAKAALRLSLAHHLRCALDRSEISVVYQPIISLATGKVVGAEALMRWHNAEHGFVPPDQFIAIAEETGLIERLGAWILQKSCQEAKVWHHQGFPLWIAVNLSPRQLRDLAFIEKVRQAIAISGLDPSFIKLEITEALLIEDIPKATQSLESLHKMGIRLALDDFGTGYSALSYLRKFPFDCLKIDRSFIGDLPGQTEAITLVKTILAMAEGLGLKTVAEGVETVEQAEFLHLQGCDYAQGYYFSRPLNAGDFQAFLRLNREQGTGNRE